MVALLSDWNGNQHGGKMNVDLQKTIETLISAVAGQRDEIAAIKRQLATAFREIERLSGGPRK